MTLSRDIETLFDHFGGNAQDYQEIGRENEARTARTRWPLLVTLDLTQPAIPAVAQRCDDVHAGVGVSAGVAGEAPAPSGESAAPGQRGKLPLFARAHRRNVPPVDNVALPPIVPASESRFSPVPEAVAAAPATEAATPAASSPTVAAAQSAQPAPAIAPVAASAAIPAPPAAGPVARASFVGAVASQTSPAGIATATATTPPRFPRASQPAVPPAPSMPPANTPPPSILGKLFKAPEAAAPQAQARGPQAAPDTLLSVFERLRGYPAQGRSGVSGNAQDTPAPASNAWLVSGPRRS